jgi:hypothetical protein
VPGRWGAVARSAKQEALAAVKSYQEATRKLKGLLGGVELGLDILASSIRAGDSAMSVLRRTDASSSRQGATQTMTEFEDARRRLRIAILRFGQAQGDSVADLAEAIGISRQLAYRMLGQAD